jgi:hypothetical protein
MIKSFFLTFLISCQILLSAQNKLFQKRALIIAIGEYPVFSEWGSISSGNDIPLIKTALVNQLFTNDCISILKDSVATKQGIVASINQLIKKTTIGDYVVIHYSGHGQQITDDNGDEIDGYDEALVPYDAPAFYENNSNYRGELHLRDDEFGQLLDNLRKKIGKDGQLIVTIDACHSGTGTRGDAKVRGGNAPFEIPFFKNSKKKAREQGSGVYEINIEHDQEQTEKSPFIIISATQFNELDYETTDDDGNPVGPLSYSIAKTFASIKPEETYHSIFMKTMSIMSKKVPYQTPTIEGAYRNKLFNGKIVLQQEYFKINQILSSKAILLDGGKIQGVGNGDKIGLYPAGTLSTENIQPLITGYIEDADNFNSKIILNKDYQIENQQKYWVFVIEKKIEGKCNIKLHGFTDLSFKRDLKKLLKEYHLVNVDTTISELTIINKKDRIIIQQNAQGINLFELKKPVETEQINTIISQYAQSEFIRKLSLNDENYRVEIEMIPVVPAFDKDGEVLTNHQGNFIIKDTLKIESLIQDGKIYVDENDYIMLKIINKGKKDTYFNIIELQPDGHITPVFPLEATPTSEIFLEAGQTFIPRNFLVTGFAPPYGPEMYKVFATLNPINLTSIITKQGSASKGSLSDIEKVILSTYSNSKGDESSSVRKRESGSTFDFIFIIKDKD